MRFGVGGGSDKNWNEDKVSSRHPRSYGNEFVDDEADQSVPEQGKGQGDEKPIEYVAIKETNKTVCSYRLCVVVPTSKVVLVPT